MKYFALSLMVVLAMATVATAEITVSVVDNGVLNFTTPENLLHSYTVMLNTGSFKAFEGVCLVNDDGTPATVHNASLRSGLGGSTINPISWASDLPAGYETEEFALSDTRFLIERPGTIFGNLADTDDDTNPGDVEDYGGGASGAHLGWGQFTGENTFGYTAATAISGPVAFMQVVVPEGSSPIYLRGSAADLDTGGTFVFDEKIGEVPEPGTIVMLLAGALCLLGIRRK